MLLMMTNELVLLSPPSSLACSISGWEKALNAAELRLEACKERLNELQSMFDNQMAEKKRIEDGAMALQRKMNQVIDLNQDNDPNAVPLHRRGQSPLLFIILQESPFSEYT